MIDMNDTKNELARTESLAFAHALAPSYSTQLGERLIGAYLIGSLAHGGFSHRYSDIDVALSPRTPSMRRHSRHCAP